MSDPRREVRELVARLAEAMETDGGGVDILSLGTSHLTLALRGSCTVCPSRSLSADALIGRVRARFPDLTDIRVLLPEGAAVST